MKHVHAMDIRPDVITRTGVIQPYAMREVPPVAVARHSVAAMRDLTNEPRARVAAEIQPEEFVSRAKRIATALAQGKRLPPGTDRRLMEAAQMIRSGKPFTVRSAGRSAQVQPTSARGMNGLGQTTIHTLPPPSSWLGRRRRVSQTSSAGRPRWTSKGWAY